MLENARQLCVKNFSMVLGNPKPECKPIRKATTVAKRPIKRDKTEVKKTQQLGIGAHAEQ